MSYCFSKSQVVLHFTLIKGMKIRNLHVVRWVSREIFLKHISVSLTASRQRMEFPLDTFLSEEQQRNYAAGAVFQISIVTSRTLGKYPEWSLCKDLAFTPPLCLPLSLCLCMHGCDCRGSLGCERQEQQQLFR